MDAQPAKVLLIDDNKDFTDTLSLGLRTCGHTVMCVNDPLRALDTARIFRPEIIVCDLSMPSLNGQELAQLIRAEETLNAVRLVATTGYDDLANVTACLAAGFDVFLPKPFDLWEITALLAPEARALRGRFPAEAGVSQRV